MIDQGGLEALRSIARSAGAAIMEVYAAGAGVSWTKDDNTPLTEADLRADRVIADGLRAAFPGVYVLSEESRSAGTLAPDAPFFLVDPLDGTREFLNRNGEFTVNIAYVAEGCPVAGVVAAPALGTVYAGLRGDGAWRDDGNGRVRIATGVRPGGPLRVIGSRSHGGDRLAAWLARLGGAHEFVAAGSSLKFCRLAEGQADVYPRLGPTSQWDTAAGQAVLEAAGGVVLDGAGVPLRYGAGRPILNPDFIALASAQLEVPPLAA